MAKNTKHTIHVPTTICNGLAQCKIPLNPREQTIDGESLIFPKLDWLCRTTCRWGGRLLDNSLPRQTDEAIGATIIICHDG